LQSTVDQPLLAVAAQTFPLEQVKGADNRRQ
jgi:hypothetical protein